MLSDKSLRRLNRDFGTNFDRAYRRNQEGEGRQIVDGVCVHSRLDFHSGAVVRLSEEQVGAHWSSCFKDRDGWKFVGNGAFADSPITHTVPLFVNSDA